MSGVGLERPQDNGIVGEAWLDVEAIIAVRLLDDRIVELTALEQQRDKLERMLLGNDMPEHKGHKALLEGATRLQETMQRQWPFDFVGDADTQDVSAYVNRVYTDTVTLPEAELRERKIAAKRTLGMWRTGRSDDETGDLAKHLTWATGHATDKTVGYTNVGHEDDSRDEGSMADDDLPGEPIVLDGAVAEARDIEQGTLLAMRALRDELNTGGNEAMLLAEAYKWLGLSAGVGKQIHALHDKTQIAHLNHACGPQLFSTNMQLRAISGLLRRNGGKVSIYSLNDQDAVPQIQSNLDEINKLQQRIRAAIDRAPKVDLGDLAGVGFGLYGNESSLHTLADLGLSVVLGTPLRARDLRGMTGSMVSRLTSMCRLLENGVQEEDFMNRIIQGAIRQMLAKKQPN